MKKRMLSLLLVISMLFGFAVPSYAAGGETSEATEGTAPKLEISSDILGLANTNNKSTLKNEAIYLGASAGPGDQAIYWYDENGDIQSSTEDGLSLKGDTVTYSGSAVIKLSGDNIDASKTDFSGITFTLQDSNTTHADEMVVNEENITVTTSDDQVVFKLNEGALEWNNWDYYDAVEEIDANSGREWSMMGGDGNGLYEFIFQVSGVTYDGEPVEDAYFRAYVYIYGRSSADLGLSTEFVENTDSGYTPSVAQTSETQWSWYTEGSESAAAKEPYMNDHFTDYFTLTWPEGTDASGITAEDVTVTLRSRFGDEYVLSTETGYGEHEYVVRSDAGQTVVAVTYQQWAYIPVYNTLEVSIKLGEDTVSNTWDISSVATYGVQTGGGGVTVDNTVVVQNYYGLTGLTLANAANTTYTLTTVIDGTTYFYVEKDGVGSLEAGTVSGSGWFATVTPPEGAYTGDATDMYHVAVKENCLYYLTPPTAPTETKTVDGEDITLSVNFSAPRTTAQMLAGGAALEPGYNTYNNGADKWPWTLRYQSGWTPETNPTCPTSDPYAAYPYGFAAGTAQEDQPYYEAGLNESTGGPGGPGGSGESETPESNAVSGTYTYGAWELTLNGDDTFVMTDGDTTVEGTYTYNASYGGWGMFKKWTVSVTLDDSSLAALSDLIPWYGSISLSVSGDENNMVLGDSFTISIDVSKGLISNEEDYTIVTVPNPDSPTGYTTTITVKDRGYESVYAYGDWEAVWADQKPAADGVSYDVTYSPDKWENGMNYATSSVLPLTKNADGDWSITLNLASSVMGVICYHDIALEDLHDLFPQKISFYVPWDSEKQSNSFDWSLAFPNEDAAGDLSFDVVTEDGYKLSVYLPAGYNANDKDTKYPVLYMIPGGGSTYRSWFTDGMIHNIFDNAIANGEVLPTILVSMQREDVTSGDDVIADIVNYIDSNYNTYADAEYRALAGVSMGSVAATNIWLKHPDMFGYWIFLSGANKELFQVSGESYDFSTSDAAVAGILGQLQSGHYFTGGGTIDFNMYDGDNNSAPIVDLNAWLDHYEIAYNTDVVVGVHNWPIWTQLMISYVPNLLWADLEVSDAPGADVSDTSPKTADEANIGQWLFTLMCSGSALGVTTLRKKRCRN